MRISVIIPAYNVARYLPETIESVLSQTIPDWELIVIDDGSQDCTPQIAQDFAAKDPRIRSYTQPNAGVAAARNAGYAVSNRRSQFICYLDHDDMWRPDALETLECALERNPRAVAAGGLPESMNSANEPLRNDSIQAYCRERYAVHGTQLVLLADNAPTTFACFAVRNCIITPGLVMVRRTAHDRVGVFDQDLSGCDDWDMWLRLSRLGDIAYVDRVVLRYRLHAGSQSQRHRVMGHREALVYRKMFAYADETPERRRLLHWGCRHRARLIARDRVQWARTALRRGNTMEALRQLRHALTMYWRFASGSLPG